MRFIVGIVSASFVAACISGSVAPNVAKSFSVQITNGFSGSRTDYSNRLIVTFANHSDRPICLSYYDTTRAVGGSIMLFSENKIVLRRESSADLEIPAVRKAVDIAILAPHEIQKIDVRLDDYYELVPGKEYTSYLPVMAIACREYVQHTIIERIPSSRELGNAFNVQELGEDGPDVPQDIIRLYDEMFDHEGTISWSRPHHFRASSHELE